MKCARIRLFLALHPPSWSRFVEQESLLKTGDGGVREIMRKSEMALSLLFGTAWSPSGLGMPSRISRSCLG